MFPVYCMFCFATTVFNTRVNVYFQGNRKCSFLPGCACLYLYWLTHITCFENKMMMMMMIKVTGVLATCQRLFSRIKLVTLDHGSNALSTTVPPCHTMYVLTIIGSSHLCSYHDLRTWSHTICTIWIMTVEYMGFHILDCRSTDNAVSLPPPLQPATHFHQLIIVITFLLLQSSQNRTRTRWTLTVL